MAALNPTIDVRILDLKEVKELIERWKTAKETIAKEAKEGISALDYVAHAHRTGDYHKGTACITRATDHFLNIERALAALNVKDKADERDT